MLMENTWNEPKEIQEIEYSRHLTISRMIDAQKLRKISKILEVGCHVGFSTYVFVEEGVLRNREYIGIDIDEEALVQAEKKKAELGWNNIQFRKLSLFEINRFFYEEFDLVIAEEVLEHMDIHNALKCIWLVLKPCGSLVFSVPYKETKECSERWCHKICDLNETKIQEILIKTGFSLERFVIKDIVWPTPEPSEKILFANAKKSA